MVSNASQTFFLKGGAEVQVQLGLLLAVGEEFIGLLRDPAQ
ncbi:hypothetical protein [Pseudomonas sp. TH31]|nr:hypothetical protein [Pseudomonas sp. TH31]